MADLSDVMDALEQIALQAAFPNGTAPGIPSVLGAGKSVVVAQGWPQAADIDLAMGRNQTLVSIFAVPSSSSDVGQPFLTEDAIVAPPVHGLTATVSGASVTLSGVPGAGEYVTAVIGGQGYTYLTQTGDTASSAATGLASALQGVFPGTVASGSSLQIATSRDIEVRIGAPATVATRLHRQRIQFRVSVWAPTPADRAGVARAVDVALKRNLTFALPDQSQALMTFQGTNLDDKFENEGTFRRDLIVNVTFDTVDTYTAYEVTSVGLTTTLSPQ